jgi:SET domain-containing protein
MKKSLTWLAPGTQVRESPIAGRGLFARAPIVTGSIVAVKGGAVMTTEDWQGLETSLGSAEIQVSEDLFIAPRTQDEREGSMVFTNHSCEPNVALQGQIVFVAMRDIAAGEELTHDWATTDDLDYKMNCNCRAPACRGVITGRDWMKPEIQEKYRGWFCWFLQRKIDAQE